ncbi:MAG TPA: EthD family reductase [Gaiellaceae bacterium]|nr:EthD family reductase [Gaiellaceae bacterium]
MVRAVIQYEREPDPERYQRHLDEFVAPIECKAFRHGKAFGAAVGEPPFAYVAEFEWDDKDAFKAAVRSEEFAASGKDAMEMGIPFTVTFVELS